MTPPTDNGPSPADRPRTTQPPRGLVGLMLQYPMTSLTLITAIALFLAVFDYDRGHPNDRLGGLTHYGAVTNLRITTTNPANQRDAAELNGPFQLWDGESWRILVTGFHHIDVFHLIMNAMALVYLGWLLEPRIGSVKLFVFLMLATPISVIPPLLIGGAVVGLSGGIYAMFGLLFVMRRDNPVLQELMPDSVVQLALLWIPIGIVLSALSIMSISNLGHAAGLAYGYAAGWVFYSPRGRQWPMFRRLFYAAHLLVIPGVHYIVQPEWNGRYHWYLASQRGISLEERIAHLEAAVDRNPHLAAAWRELAESHRRNQDFVRMWDAAIRGVYHNRSDRKLPEQIAGYWLQSGRSLRQEALQKLRDVFGDEANSWQETLGMNPAEVATTVPVPKPVMQNVPVFWKLSSERNVGVPQPQTAPTIDPDAPGSAEEGTGL